MTTATEENVPAAKTETAPKVKKTPAERKQARGDLLTLLLIVLAFVGIIYLGLNIGWLLIAIIFGAVGKAVGF